MRTQGGAWDADIPVATRCFYCGRQIRAIAIYWIGDDGELWLHPPCVVELTIRLYRDVHEVEVGTQAYVAGRVG